MSSNWILSDAFWKLPFDMNAISNHKLDKNGCVEIIKHAMKIAFLQKQMKLKNSENDVLEEKVRLMEQWSDLKKCNSSREVPESTLYGIKRRFRDESVPSPSVSTMAALVMAMLFLGQLLATKTVLTSYKAVLVQE